MTLYMPPLFAVERREALIGFIERYAFGTLVTTSGAGDLNVSHIPFLPRRDERGSLRLLAHVARANPHWQALAAARDNVAIFHGPHGYVSPGWYANHPAVPTWNYAVVHAHGGARLMDEAELHELVTELSATYEAGRTPPWRLSEQPAAFVDGMLKSIVGFEIAVERLEGKFKLSQNRPAEIPRVIAALEERGDHELAALMREHPPGGG